MEFSQWVKREKCSVNGISRQTGISRNTIKSAISKNADLTLKTAMTIYNLTKGEVSFEEMLKDVKE